MIYHLTFVEFCLTLMISNQFDIMKSYKFTLIRWSNHFHYSGGSTCDGSSGLFCLLTWKVGGIGIVPVGSYKAFTELPLLGLAPSTSTKWCDVAEFLSYLLSNTILLHKNNSSPLQNRKRDSLFLSSRAELPFREGISIQKQAFLGCQAVLCWCCRLENAGYMLPSTSNRLINMKSTSGMLCGRMFTATSVWRKCLWRCVFLSVLHNSFAKKRARTYCAKWQKIPHAHSHLRKAWLQYVIKLQVSNSIKHRIAGSMVDGNITVPNGAWVRSYDKLNAWELRHLWCGKTAQRKLCEAWDEVGFSPVQHAMKSLSIGHFPTRSLSFNTQLLGQRATCSCGVLHGWSHDPMLSGRNCRSECQQQSVKRRNTGHTIQYWQNFMAIQKIIHGSKLWSVLPPSRWGPLYSHGCKKSCGDVNFVNFFMATKSTGTFVQHCQPEHWSWKTHTKDINH